MWNELYYEIVNDNNLFIYRLLKVMLLVFHMGCGTRKRLEFCAWHLKGFKSFPNVVSYFISEYTMDILQAQVYSGDICKSLVCHDPTTGNCYILGDAPAAMGTTCGNKKVKRSDLHLTLVHVNSILQLTSFLSNENNNSISFFFVSCWFIFISRNNQHHSCILETNYYLSVLSHWSNFVIVL